MEQAQRIVGVCYICGTIIHEGHVMALVMPRNDRPRKAHLYCYALMQKRRQRQEQRERALLPS